MDASLRTWLLLLALAPGVLGCAGNFRQQAHKRIAQRMQCSGPELRLREIGDKRYEAEGCGKRGIYRCFHKRHIKASGAKYVKCERE